MAARTSTSERRSARERLVAAAQELFYKECITAVGIARVIEHAGVAKASLYDCFGSKEGLIRAYLTARHEARQKRLQERLAQYDNPRDRLLGVFDVMAEVAVKPNFGGRPFIRPTATTPARTRAPDVSCNPTQIPTCRHAPCRKIRTRPGVGAPPGAGRSSSAKSLDDSGSLYAWPHGRSRDLYAVVPGGQGGARGRDRGDRRVQLDHVRLAPELPSR